MAIFLTNKSGYVGQRGDTHWWKWTAYLEGSEGELDEIAFVEYHLHPSFPNPIRRIKMRSGGFPLKSKGWGVFELTAKVVFQDGRRPKVLKHWLEFSDDGIDD